MLMEFKDKVKFARQKLMLSQADFAKKLGVAFKKRRRRIEHGSRLQRKKGSGQADKRKKKSVRFRNAPKIFEKVYFYSIHSLAIKAPYVLYFVMVKYGLLSQKQILGKVHLSRMGARALSFRGTSSHMRTVCEKQGTHGERPVFRRRCSQWRTKILSIGSYWRTKILWDG